MVGACSSLHAVVLSNLTRLSWLSAACPRLALPGWSKLPFLVPRNASFLSTTTLEGPPQPN